MTGGRDFRQPLAIGKVSPGGKASRAGIAEGHHILTVNGEDVTQLAHLDAQNRIKAAKTTLTLEISNTPVPKPVVPDINVPSYTPPSYTKPASEVSHTQTKSYISGNKSPTSYNTSPAHSKSVSLPSTMSAPRSPSYSNPHIRTPSIEEKSVTPDIEYRRVDSRDSQRRLYEELQDSEYAPTAHQSTLQSPSMQALARSSAYSQHDPDPQTMQVTEEIRDMILEDDNGRRNGNQQSAYGDAALRPTGVKVYEPQQPQQKFNNRPSPAPYSGQSSNDFVQPPSPRSPTAGYGNNSHPLSSNNSQPSRSTAAGNISKFLQSSGAKQGAPTFLKPLQDLQCPLGDPAVLEIRIGNTLPVPTIAWYHNERPVRESREKDIKFLSRGIVHTLVLGEFTKDMVGRFRCVLTNRHGSTSCSSFLTIEQLGDSGQYTAPQTYSNSNSSGYGYQPSYTSNYSQPQQRVSNPPVASNSVGLYSQNTAQEAYGAMSRKRDSRDSQDEESAVMRALREEGHVGDGKPQQQSRSMKMLEETLMPESDDL